MSYADLVEKATHVFTCAKTGLKFWEHDGNIWGDFSNSRWFNLKPCIWGKSNRLENIIDYQISVYKNRQASQLIFNRILVMQTVLAQTLLKKRFSDRSNSPSGISCTFFKITSKWGIKSYTKQYKRDDAYNAQYDVALNGLAPKVGDKFEIEIEDETIYCYVTEVAETLQTEEYRELVKKIFCESVYSDEDYAKYEQLSNDLEEEWLEKMEEYNELTEEVCGWRNHDCHTGNYGLLNGQLVCIDFGND